MFEFLTSHHQDYILWYQITDRCLIKCKHIKGRRTIDKTVTPFSIYNISSLFLYFVFYSTSIGDSTSLDISSSPDDGSIERNIRTSSLFLSKSPLFLRLPRLSISLSLSLSLSFSLSLSLYIYIYRILFNPVNAFNRMEVNFFLSWYDRLFFKDCILPEQRGW